jgi:hypothetical protein
VARLGLASLVVAGSWTAELPAQSSGTASAEPTPPGETARTVVVMIPEATPPLPISRLADALRSQLAEIGVGVEIRVEAEPAATAVGHAARNVIAMIWIERSEETLVVHFYEPAGSSLRERYIPVSSDDAASLEEIAVVVSSAVGALVERINAGSSARTGAPSHDAPAAPQPRTLEKSSRPYAQVSIAYLFTDYAEGADWQHGPSLYAALRAPRAPLAAGVGYTWLRELRRTSAEVTVAIERHPLEAFVGTPFELARNLRLEPELAFVADPITRTTLRAGAALEITRPSTVWSWALSPRLRLALCPLRRIWLFGSAGADVLLNRFEHVVAGTTERTALSPLAIRPRLQLGSAIDL